MLYPLAILAQAADEAPPVPPVRFTLQPPPGGLPTWAWYSLMAAGFLLAAGMAVYLYAAQRSVASRRVVYALTAIRSLLIFIMFLLLVGPGCQFSRTHQTGGTLWLMVDQSQSMAQLDPQSTPTERLRWADALGYLPPDRHASDLARQAARLDALRAELSSLQTTASTPVEDADAARKVETLVKDLRRWNQQLLSVAEAFDKDSHAHDDDGKASRALNAAAAGIAKGLEKAQTRTKPDQIAADLPWRETQLALGPPTDAMDDLADAADEQLVKRNEPAVAAAIERVSKLSRAKLAELALTDAAGTGRTAAAFKELFPKQDLKVLGFGDQPQVILPARETAGATKAIQAAWAKPSAPATDVVTGLRMIGDQVVQGEPASVVIVSDGRQNRNGGELADAARRLAARGIRVYALAVGSREIAPDAAVENLDAPDWVFKGDTLKLSALLRIDGLYKKDAAGNYAGPKKTITTELHRSQVVAGRVEDTLIDTKDVEVDVPRPGERNQAHPLVAFAERRDQLPPPGLYDYRVEIKPVPDEAVTENNSQTVRVSVKDHKLAALVVEDQPRYEYRYASNYLGRDQRIKLQTVLLQAARIDKVKPPEPVKASPDNERTEAQVLPQTQEDWYKFDLIVLGDLPPEALPKAQQEMLAKAVKDRGATLIVLAGALNMPANWGADRTQNPLAELFPVEASSDWTPQALQVHLKGGYRPAIAPDGRDNLLTQFGIDADANAKAWAEIQKGTDDPRSPMNWYWHSEYTQAKGGAQVIWQIMDNAPKPADARSVEAKAVTELEAAKHRALLTTMNVGLGKVMFLGGDATWRLRQVNGQNLHERFWGQVVRWVVGNDLPAGGQFVRFGTDKPRYVDGEAAVVTARISDKHLAPLQGQKVKVIARSVAPGTGIPNDPKAPPSRVEAEMTETPESPGQYRATLHNLPAGQVELTLVGGDVPQLLADDPTATQQTLTIDVEKGLNLEQRNINTDRTTLAAVAQAGGGASLDAIYGDVLAGHIPELNYRVTTAEQIGLFADPKDPWTRYTHWAFLATFIVLVSAEWIIRKAGGLV